MDKSFINIIIKFLGKYKNHQCKIVKETPGNMSYLLIDQNNNYGYVTTKLTRVPKCLEHYKITFIISTAKKINKNKFKQYEVILADQFTSFLTDETQNVIAPTKITCSEQEFLSLADINLNKFLRLMQEQSRKNNVRSDTEFRASVEKIKEYLKKNDYPGSKCPMYKTIKELVIAFDNGELSETIIKELNTIPGWIFDYKRLQVRGKQFEILAGKMERGETLNEDDLELLNYARNKFHKKKLSPYLANRLLLK